MGRSCALQSVTIPPFNTVSLSQSESSLKIQFAVACEECSFVSFFVKTFLDSSYLEVPAGNQTTCSKLGGEESFSNWDYLQGMDRV